MLHTELRRYIESQITLGVTKDQLKATLLQTGWNEVDINDSMPTATPDAPTLPPLPVDTMPIDSKPAVVTAQPVKKSSGKSIVFVIFLVILVLGGIGGAYAYTTYMADPNRVFSEMAKVSALKSYSYDVAMDVSATSVSTAEKQTQTIAATGDIDMQDEKNPKVTLNLTMSGNSLPSAVSGQMIYLADMLYVKITQFPELGLGIDTTPIMNTWIQFPMKQLESITPKSSLVTTPMTEDQKTQLQTALVNDQFIVLSKNIPDNSVTGVDTYHYTYTVDKTKLLQFIKDASTIMKTELSDADIASYQKGMDSVTTMTGAIWIGKKDYMPYRVTFKAVGDSTTYSQDMNITMNLKNFNTTPEITAPASSKTSDQILQELMPTASVTPTPTTRLKK